MQHMFSSSPWNAQQGGVRSLGFIGAPMQVPIVGGPRPTSPPPVQAPPGAVPMGKKEDCPVCRSFGGGF
jgi:hypothetical protein